ncbi:hypothetical protein C0989_010845 [Termitomyces sp. Mn162]|nr:hypothetical protein C0989_010845 [Termitomyces sp. Mn162]
MAPSVSVVIPTAPCQASRPLAPIAVASSASTDHFANLKCAIKHDGKQAIVAILQLPLFASALIGICNTAKAFPGLDSDHTQYIGTTHLHFADESNYARLSEQKGLVDTLSQILPTLDHLSTNDAPDIQHFFTFADTLILIDKKWHKEQRKCKIQEQQCHQRKACDTEMLGLTPVEPKGKPKPKKVKVTPSLTSFKLSSNAVLALLGQIDAAIENHLLDKDNAALLAELQKHHEAINLTAQQQLYSLDLGLQTFCHISAQLKHLDKVLGSSEIEKTSSLLGDL